MSKFWLSLSPLAILAAMMLVVLTLSRVVLAMIWWQRVEQTDSLWFVMLQGLRFDLVLIGMVMIPPLLLMSVLTCSNLTLPLWKAAISAYVTLIMMIVIFMELATPSFVEQFDARPNILFFEYLGHPKELLSTLWGAYRPQLLIGLPLVSLIGYGVWRFITATLVALTPVSILLSVPASVALILISVLCARSTFDHRPVNASTVALTTDALVNELPLNSTYTVSYAAYELQHEDDGGVRYGSIDADTAVDIVKKEMLLPENVFFDNENTTWHYSSAPTRLERPKNLVIVLEESLGAEFVGSMGGLDLTPNIDALREQGMSFDRLYATGTRSVRGIEAVITGFLPTPSRSVVKLTRSQRNFFTLAGFLKEAGYDTSFIYGGEAHFDNMRRFFMNNGFDRVVDEKDYINPVFTGSWGVSDEDLFRRAHAEFEEMSAQPVDKPFFSLVFSSSNHTPFEFPDGRIELYDDEKQTVNNAVKYADYALGEFFKLARSSSYWQDTIFLVVSDHNSRVYGDALVPIDRFRIPGIILGEGVSAQRINRITSQVDLAPTLISMMGLSGIHPMPGRDLKQFPADAPGRAMMQFNGLHAYLEDDKVAVLQKDRPAQIFEYIDNRLVRSSQQNLDLIKKAVAHVTWASHVYSTQQYQATKPIPTTQLSAKNIER